MRVTPVSFPNREGHRLSGMLHEPDPQVARGVCVLLLSPGIKGRVGPHRLYLKMAARLVPVGYHVLRFDYHGLGDSEGVLGERVLADVYCGVQNGRYVDDTRVAIDWLERTAGVGTFVASGLCGGAISGLLTAAVDERVQAVWCLGVPVTFDGGQENWGRYLTQGQLDDLKMSYLGKLASPAAWARFFSGQSSYDVIWKIVRRMLGLTQAVPPPQAPRPDAPPPDNANPKFASAFFAVTESGRRLLLVFSGGDRLGWEFDEKFAARHAERLAAVKDRYEVLTIDGANHILSDRRWVEQMLDHSVAWLKRRWARSSTAHEITR